MTETGSGVVYDGVPLDGVESARRRRRDPGAGPDAAAVLPRRSDPRSADGWFPTGDLGGEPSGALLVDGRRGDLIITGGENVWPEPVEAVYGRSRRGGGGRGGAPTRNGVTRRGLRRARAGPPTLDEVREQVKALPAFCAPERVVVGDPRTALGKIRRAELIEQVSGP